MASTWIFLPPPPDTSGSQQPIQFQDEGINLGSSGTATTLDFTGAGVTTTRIGNTVTVNVTGGGGGGSGDVNGPASATNNNLAVFDGTTGKLIKDGAQSVAGVLNRANHTGTQLASTISDFNTAVASTALLKANNLSDLASVTTAKTNLALQNVDNTSDANKPVSTAQAAADAAVQAFSIQRANHTGTQSAATITGLATVATSGSASDLGTGTLPLARLVNITDTQIAAANKDGLAATASMRTLGTGAQQAAAGNDARLSDSRTPTGSAGGELAGSYPNPTLSTAKNAEIAGKNAGILFEDEGIGLGTAGTVDEVDFTGTGVTASRTGNKVTVNISGGGGGGQAATQYQDDGTNLGTSGTVDTLNFIGTQVTATRVGNTVTVLPQAKIVESNISVSTVFTSADIFKTHRVTTGGTDRTMTLPTTGVVDGDMISFEKVDTGSGFVIINSTSFAMLFQQSDFMRLRYSATLAAWDIFIYTIAPFVQNFTSSGTWTKRPLLKYAYVAVISAGGGGGSGRTRAAGSAGCGGGGGGGGGFSDRMIPASQLGATETVTVGVGGAGGVAQATASSTGNIGGVGGVSQFGTAATVSAVMTRAPGGGPGGTATTTGTAAGGIGLITGGAGAQGVTAGAAGAQGSSSARGGTGGGSGGGVTTANVANAGGQGSGNSLALNSSANVGAGAAGTAGGGAGGNGATISTTLAAGAAGGGGGGGNAAGNGGLGGDGGSPGGGGGGGGAGTDGSSSGAGGRGGDGLVQVINFF